ncbi:unnamed protein product [Ranitomeya imitator]|uniref:alpha-1,2-Mannosidase n=1 Tax=Ranitomeya imitator TaxID=111125 RepID=A0ABN9LF66_9NEOB|nr:unnamed protein product [Ranitomeya imitator]
MHSLSTLLTAKRGHHNKVSCASIEASLMSRLLSSQVLNRTHEFEDAVRKVINDVNLDNDIVVSVFETNIRVLGGLLGGHSVAIMLKEKGEQMLWYNDELLHMAKELGYKLLPAFNTTSGLPYPRVNLKFGIRRPEARTGTETDTCTACAGTLILEFAALSRFTGIAIFEEHARKALDFIWEKRQRSSNLVGVTINIHTGDWVRKECKFLYFFIGDTGIDGCMLLQLGG